MRYCQNYDMMVIVFFAVLICFNPRRDDARTMQCIKCHNWLHGPMAPRHPAIRLRWRRRMTTVTTAILRVISSRPRLPRHKKMLHAACQMTDIITWLAHKCSGSHLAIYLCAKKRFTAPPEETGLYYNSGRGDTSLWESMIPSKGDAHLQYRLQTGLGVPSQTAIGANHRQLLQEREREREIWSDDYYNLNPIGGNQRRHPTAFKQRASGPRLSHAREIFCATPVTRHMMTWPTCQPSCK